MSAAADLVTERLVRLGWTIMHVVEPALVIEGRDMRVFSVVIRRPGARGFVVVLLDAVDGDEADRWAGLGGPSPAIASRRMPSSGWKVRAEVLDLAATRAELEFLAAAFPIAGDSWFESLLALYAERGWQIDQEASAETFLDEPSWKMRAIRGERLLELHGAWGRWRATGRDGIEEGDSGLVSLVSEHVSAFGSVLSHDLAAQLVDAICEPRPD